MSDLSDSSGAGTSVDDSPQFVGDYGPKSLMMSTNDQQELKSPPPLSPRVAGSPRDSQPSTPPPIVGGDKKARGNAWNQFQLENKHAYAHETPKSRVSAMSKAFKDLKAGDGGAAALEALRAKDQARREGRKKLSMKLATTTFGSQRAERNSAAEQRVHDQFANLLARLLEFANKKGIPLAVASLLGHNQVKIASGSVNTSFVVSWLSSIFCF